MTENHLLIIFIGISSLAILIQAIILIAIYTSTKKTAARVEDLVSEFQQHGVPALKLAREVLEENKPKIDEIVENFSAVSTTAREQLVRVDATLTEVIERTRMQVIRADELATRTMDKVEETTEMVQQSVLTPVRAITGVLSGLSAGLGMLLANRRARKHGQHHIPSEDMFI